MIDTKEKLAGILIPVFALREQNDLGIGDTVAVKSAIDFCQRNKAAVLQVLPINETGGDNSPYNAISSIALDPVLLAMAPDMVPGLSQEIIDRHAPNRLLQELRTGAVDYTRVKSLKLDILREAYQQFETQEIAGNSKQAKEFAKFKEEQSEWLRDYATFRTLIDVHHGDARWPLWDKLQQSPKTADQWFTQAPNTHGLNKVRDFFAYVQWVAWRQWKDVRTYADNRGVRLMGDIPFGVSRYSADVWANQELFDLEWSGGAPPEQWFKDDPFTAKWGQNWGLPVYDWSKHKAQKFKWWRNRVEKCVEIFNYFRIDHVLGFFRVYSFPWQPERNGEFVELTEEEAKKVTGGKLPKFLPRSDEKKEDAAKNAKEGQALLEMVLDAAGNAGVVAEDLGSLVPDYVRPLLQKMKIPGFSIPYWERTTDKELKAKEKLPEISLATYATHDHQPLVSFYEDMVQKWLGPDGHEHWLEVQRLMKFLGADENEPPKQFTDELHSLFMKALLESNCWLAVFMITELLATAERFNQPGTSGGSNWSRRLDHPLSYYENNEPFKQRISNFSQLVKETRRLPQAWQVGTIR